MSQTLSKPEQLAKLRRLHLLLSKQWDCGQPGCDGKPHRGQPYKHARADQLPPPGDWYTWLLCTGRGWGKTKTGCEFTKRRALAEPGHRVAIICPDFAVGRDVVVEGESGLRGAIQDQGVIPWDRIASWNRSIGELILTNGSMFKIFGTHTQADAESLRGYQCHTAHFEELATQRWGSIAWNMLEFALRLGSDPRIVVTTTPKRIPIIKDLLTDPSVAVVRGALMDNADNLPAQTVARLVEKYEGTTLGRQELLGELIDAVDGALWTPELIEASRVKQAPDLERIVVAIDPATTAKPGSDETGIVVMGAADGHLYVLADLSGLMTPEQWSRKAIEAYEYYQADRIVAETNNGGDLVERSLRIIAPKVPYRSVTATRGKAIRAEPVVAEYERSRVHHIGVLAELEAQMQSWLPTERWSPDRMDALVWAATELSFGPPKRKIRSVS